MEEYDIINTVIDVLRQHPDIQYCKTSDSSLKILRKDNNGFDIVLETDLRENTLHFSSFHQHFDHTEEEINEMIDLLVLALTGNIRIKVYSKNGNAYKWVSEIHDKDGNWIYNETLSRINLDFSNDAEITYYLNDF